MAQSESMAHTLHEEAELGDSSLNKLATALTMVKMSTNILRAPLGITFRIFLEIALLYSRVLSVWLLVLVHPE